MGIMTETTINLAQAARLLPPLHGHGQSAHPATLTRWINRGLKGISGRRCHLEAVRFSGFFLTSREALARFLDAIAVPAGPQTASQPQKPTVTARMIAATQKAEDMGV